MAKFIPQDMSNLVQGEFNLEWTYDKKKWQDAIDAYIGYTHKTAEEATFRQTKNLLFFIAREMPQSRFKKGMPVSRLSEYVGSPLVAGLIVAKHFKKKGALIAKESLHTQRGVTGRAWMMNGSRGKLKFAGWRKDSRQRYYTKEMAIKQNEKYRKIINSHLGFSQLIPMKALDRIREIAKEFGVNIGGVGRIDGNKPNKKYKGEDAVVVVTKGAVRVDIAVHSAYTFKKATTLMGKPQNANAQFYDDAIRKAIPIAIDKTIDDIKQYILQKQRKENPLFGYSREDLKYIAIGRQARLRG